MLWLRQTIKNRKHISNINKELEEAIVIKEGLLKEIHHRVKNNLQMISGLLTIQAKNTSDEVAKQALLDSRSRLKAVSMVHKRLYVGEGYNEVDIESFLKDVVSSYVHSELRSQDIFTLDHDDFNVHIEQAVPLGFVLHELVSNSFKHAWVGDEEKKIGLTMRLHDSDLKVVYEDNGKGLIPSEFESSNSLGLKLIKLFVVNQLKGEFEVEESEGLKINFRFELRLT
ncbi:MAG: sensor histidine kinase [Crocinitomicaceae bacterium]|nr:sensor histidine kinase [Crocinitomicaceae bacterium]